MSDDNYSQSLADLEEASGTNNNQYPLPRPAPLEAWNDTNYGNWITQAGLPSTQRKIPVVVGGQFYCTVKQISGSDVFGVDARSRVLKSDSDVTDYVIPDGVLAQFPPDDTDPSWQAASSGLLVWCEIDVDYTADPPTFSNFTIASGTSMGPMIQHDSGTGTPTAYNQDMVRFPIAELGNDANGTLIAVVQYSVSPRLLTKIGPTIATDSGGSDPQPVAGIRAIPI